MNTRDAFLPMGLVGGGPGSFVGPVHRMAAELDGRARLCAGVFSRDPERSREAGARFGIASDRVYPDFETMFTAEQSRPDGIRFVAITTPNNSHLQIAVAALAAGIHVISDKPATATLAEARVLRERVHTSSALYALTYTYTGYPLIREAQEIVARGDLGRIRKIHAEYPQGWLSSAVEKSGNRQAAWRTDPTRSGEGGCIADIGVHAFNLAEYVTGERAVALLADLAHVVEGRANDDDAMVLLRFAGGARGFIAASQIATGSGNDLRIKVWGEKGGLEWSHAESQQLRLLWPDRPHTVMHAGAPGLGAAARAATRLPVGHPEGFIEAFANIYRDFIASLEAGTLSPALCGIEEGVRGMAFIDAALKSSAAGCVWQPLVAD